MTKLEMLLETISEMNKYGVDNTDDLYALTEDAKWKDYYAKNEDVKRAYKDKGHIPTGSSKEYGELAAKGEGQVMNNNKIKAAGKLVADEARKKMEMDREDAGNMARFKKVDSNTTDPGHTIDNMQKSKQVHDKINKRVEQRKVMGESAESHLAFADMMLELLDD